MTKERFQLRRLASPEEFLQATEKRAMEYSSSGKLDHISFFAADKNCFFACQLDGQTIGCILVVRHTEDLAFIGYYYVYGPYRGKGYGQWMWKEALKLASLPEDCNIGLVALPSKQHVYERIGFKPCWQVLYIHLVASEALAILSSNNSSSGVKVLPASQAKFEDVVRYDAQVYGFSRERFLEKWLTAPNCHAFVALDKEGRVTGYAVVRTILRQDSWRIGPLFADDSTTALCLYRAVFDKVTAVQVTGIVDAEVPHGGQMKKEALEIAQSLAGRSRVDFIRMYTKGVPPGIIVNKIFSHTVTEIY